MKREFENCNLPVVLQRKHWYVIVRRRHTVLSLISVHVSLSSHSEVLSIYNKWTQIKNLGEPQTCLCVLLYQAFQWVPILQNSIIWISFNQNLNYQFRLSCDFTVNMISIRCAKSTTSEILLLQIQCFPMAGQVFHCASNSKEMTKCAQS